MDLYSARAHPVPSRIKMKPSLAPAQKQVLRFARLRALAQDDNSAPLLN
jgi:hypothetical protein